MKDSRHHLKHLQRKVVQDCRRELGGLSEGEVAHRSGMVPLEEQAVRAAFSQQPKKGPRYYRRSVH